MTAPAAISRSWPRGTLVVATVVLVLAVAVRVRILGFPLERDEGEYAYFGQLILRGIAPYAEAYNMKLPGTYLAYALALRSFGQTIEGVHLGLLVANLLTVLGVILVARRLLAVRAEALLAGAAYAVLSLAPGVFGFAAHATHFVNLFAVWGTFLLLRAMDHPRLRGLFWSGLMLGIAPLMKQHGATFVAFAVVLLVHRLWKRGTWRSRPSTAASGRFVAGVAIPSVVMMASLASLGVLRRFWFWTVTYAARYGSEISLAYGWKLFWIRLPQAAADFAGLWLLALVGLAAAAFGRGVRDGRRLPLLSFALFSLASVCPGLRFRPHYFVTMLPAVAVLAAAGLGEVAKVASRWLRVSPSTIAAAAFGLVVAAGLFVRRDYCFLADPVDLCRMVYEHRPFPESVPIARYIQAHSSADDRVLVLGSEPQIFFYSQRRSATGYVYVYPLMERHAYAASMQREFTAQAEAADPKFAVMVDNTTSWSRQPRSQTILFDWVPRFLAERYERVGVADILWPEPTVFAWDEAARGYQVQSKRSSVVVYRRIERPEVQ